MKTLKVLLLMILLAGSSAAQVSSSKSGASDVTVVKISWRRVERSNPRLDNTQLITNADYALRSAVNTARINEANSARQSGGSPPAPVLLTLPSIPDSPPTVRSWSGYIYEFTVKNTGTKTIRKLVWEYAFTDPSTQRKVGRRQYKGKVKIRPGMTANLVVRSALAPIGTIDARQLGKNPQDQSPEQMVIQRIEYGDRSVWTRTSN